MTMKDSVLVARGLRLKLLRELADLTRDELAAIAKVSSASMSYWENATHSGLSHKGAERIVAAVSQRGIICSVEWLLLGSGSRPRRGDLRSPKTDVTDTLATVHAAVLAAQQQMAQARIQAEKALDEADRVIAMVLAGLIKAQRVE
jgi:transcriptional regulator with XRE-family HTH domain